jgi:hypothetical protein
MLNLSNYINTIKAVREKANLGLKEAKLAVDAVRETGIVETPSRTDVVEYEIIDDSGEFIYIDGNQEVAAAAGKKTGRRFTMRAIVWNLEYEPSTTWNSRIVD